MNNETLNSVQQEINDVVSESPAVVNNQQPVFPDPIQQTENNLDAEPDVVYEDDPRYMGHNDKYANVVPYKLPVFDGEIETSSTNMYQIAHDIAVNYNGMREDDYFGFYYAPDTLRESWLSSITKGVINSFVELPASAVSLASLVVDGATYGVDALAQLIDKNADTTISENARGFMHWLTDEMQFAADKVKYGLGTETTDDRFATKLFYGVGNVFGSIGTGLIAKAAGKASAGIALMNGSTYDEVRKQALDNGYSGREAAIRGAGAFAGTYALDKFGFDRIASMTRGVMKETAGLAAERVMTQGASKLVGLAKRSDAAQFWRSFGMGALNTGTESVTEVLQNNVQRILAGNMGNGYTSEMFDEDVITALSSLIGGGFGIPLEIRQGFVERNMAKEAVGNVAVRLTELSQAREKCFEVLTTKGIMTKEQANDFLDDLIVNGVDHAQEVMGDSIQSVYAALTPEEITNFKQRMDSMDVTQLSGAKFKELDARVVESLKGVNMAASDKLLLRGAYQGIANWLAYYGVSPDQITPSKIYTDAREAGARRNTYGHFRPSDQSLYFKQNATYTGSPYDPLVKRLESVDKSIPHRMNTIIHEMGHMLDWKMLGIDQTKAEEFINTYIATIEKVFGETNAASVKANLDSYKRGFGGLRLGYTSKNNSTEWFAQVIGRLGHEAAEAIGLKGNPAKYVQFVNAILKGTSDITPLSKPIMDYLAKFKQVVAHNSEIIKAMVEDKGSATLNAALQEFSKNPESWVDWDNVSLEDIKTLTDVANSFVDGEASSLIGDIYEGVDLGKLDSAVDGLKMLETALNNPDATETQLETLFNDKSVNSDGAVSDAPVDVNEIMAEQIKDAKEEKETHKSRFQRQMSRKVGGITLPEHMKKAAEWLKTKTEQGPLGKMYKFLASVPDRFGISEYVWALFGKDGEDSFGLISKHEAYDDYNYEHHKHFTDRVQKEVFGKDKTIQANFSATLQKFENECAVKKFEVDFKDPRDGVVEKRKLSAFELMMVKLVAKQDQRNLDVTGKPVGLSPKERLQKSLPNQKIDDLVKLLTPEQSKYADIMGEEMDSLYEAFMDSLREQGMEIELGKIKNYWPLLDAMSQAIRSDYTNVTIARNVYAQSALGIMDAREQFNRYVSRVSSTESEFYPALRRLHDLFFFVPDNAGVMNPNSGDIAQQNYLIDTSRELNALANRRLGDKGFEIFKNLLDDFLQTRDKNLLSNSIASKMARNVTTAILSWKPMQFLKGTGNFFSHWGLADDQGQYWSDTVSGLMNPAETWKTMMKYSKQTAKRVRGQSYSEFLNQNTAGGDNLAAVAFKLGSEKGWFKQGAPALSNFIALSNVMKQAGLSPMLYGDAFSNVYGGYGLFMSFVRKYNGDMEKAGRAFDETIIRRQSSSNQAMKSLLQRRWNRSVAGNVLAFTSEGLQKWNDMIHNIEAARQGEISKSAAAKSVTSNLTSMLVYSMISFGLFDLLFGDDDEKEAARDAMWSEVVSQIAGAHVLGNAIIAPAINGMLGVGGNGSISIPVATEMFNTIRAFQKHEDGGEMAARAASMAGFFIGAPNALNVFRGVTQAATAETEAEQQAGVRRSFGVSESQANKREGIKKEKSVEKED